jgi:TRAP-type C4-dicarboxylate transport system permease small subunit
MPVSRLVFVTRFLFGIAMAALAAMAFLTVIDITLRYALSRPISGSYELVGFLAAGSLGFALPHLQATNGHVSVDLLVQLAGRPVRQALKLVTIVVALTFFLLLTWRLIVNTQTIFVSRQVSDVIGIPIWLIYVVVTIGPAVTTLVCADQLMQLLRGAPAHDAD